MLLRNDPAYWAPSRFYFAIGRLVAWLRSRGAERPEKIEISYTFEEHQNPIESNVVSSIVFVLAHVAFIVMATTVRPLALRVALLLAAPAAVAVLICGQIILFGMLVSLVRRFGLLRKVDDRRLQEPAQLVILTIEAAWLLTTPSPAARVAGAIWLALVALNLLAHIPLFLLSHKIKETDRRLRCTYAD
jgi:hypothetical protein